MPVAFHLLALTGCVLLAALRVVAATKQQLGEHPNDLLVQTTSGLVQGFLDTNTTDVPLKKWLGVPYADDTSGSNRWRPPQAVKVKPGHIIDASAYGPACMQGRYVSASYVCIRASHAQFLMVSANGGNGTSVQSEDCLLINIMAPANASNLPVYIYV